MHPDSSIGLRPAGPADVPSIAALVRAAYSKYVERIGREPKPMSADYGRAVREHQVWLAEGADGVAGVLELIPRPGHLLIENVAVAPGRQGRGLGRRLVAFAEAEARRQGLPELRLYTNGSFVENIALYTRLGYRETGREPFRGSAVVHMSKRLDD